jgi:SAM-dependent methyltransferase
MTATTVTAPPREEQCIDPECRKLVALSHELERAVAGVPDRSLIDEVEALLRPYWTGPHRLPRSPIERLQAQRTLRRVLLATGAYGLVYGWYEAFKAPYGEDPTGSLAMSIDRLRLAADGYAWIRGFDTVLECGCGAESLGLVLARDNRRWIASDIYVPELFEDLQEHFQPVGPLEFSLIDGVTLEGVADRSVDVVISRSFFEHLLLEDAQRHLRESFRVLRPGGIFVCACPAGVGAPSDVTKEFPEYDTPQGLHIKEYRVRELTADLRRAGFARVHSRFLRLRGLGVLPPALNRLKRVPPAVAAVFESLAAATWPAARGSNLRTRLWKQVWGHLGATSLLLVATKR